jgi:hypothetical protein
MSRISELLSREEVMEKQKSILDWLKYGDCNTAFFQAKSWERAKIKKIMSLICDDGSTITSQEDLEACAVDFYHTLFTDQEVLERGAILQHVSCKVSATMNEDHPPLYCRRSR